MSCSLLECQANPESRINIFMRYREIMLTEAAKNPIPQLADWSRYPQERETDWNGRKKPFVWFRHELAPGTDRFGDNAHRYEIRHVEPKSEDIFDRRGNYLGANKTGGGYKVIHNRPEPYEYVDQTRHFPVHYKELGRYKTPQEAHRAAKAHYDETHGIVRPARLHKPEIAHLPAVPRDRITGDAAAETYFGIGHGDADEAYCVWAQIGGRIRKSPLIQPGDDTATHGALWGHEITDRDFKGRYEPSTGKLSIVRPRHAEFRDLPSELLRKLYQKFTHVTRIYEF